MRRTQGFGLLEVVFAVMIVSVALLTLMATVTEAARAAGNSVHQRAAREAARAKMEEVLAGVEPIDGGGEFENRPYDWKSESEQIVLQSPQGQGTTSYTLVTVTVIYPIALPDTPPDADTPDDEEEIGRILLASIMPYEVGQ